MGIPDFQLLRLAIACFCFHAGDSASAIRLAAVVATKGALSELQVTSDIAARVSGLAVPRQTLQA